MDLSPLSQVFLKRIIMTDLFSYNKKQHEDGSITTKINIHPVLSFVLIASFIIVFIASCEAMLGK